jgi:hypothetical protein
MASKSVGGPKAARRSKTVVGRSHRTPFKHFLLDGLLKREANIFHSPKARLSVWANPEPWHIIDMNAGDGGVTEKDNPCPRTTSSPSIIDTHARRARNGRSRPKVTLIEKNEATFQKLHSVANGRPYTELLHQDSRLLKIKPTCKNQAIFIHSDPNALSDWCLTTELLNSLTPTTTMLLTLGCNVGGLKRLSREEREPWFGHVRDVVRTTANFHNLTLIIIENDPAQWAYLVRAPFVWTKRVEAEARKGGEEFNLPLDMASLKGDMGSQEKFDELLGKLFLTKRELIAC